MEGWIVALITIAMFVGMCFAGIYIAKSGIRKMKQVQDDVRQYANTHPEDVGSGRLNTKEVKLLKRYYRWLSLASPSLISIVISIAGMLVWCIAVFLFDPERKLSYGLGGNGEGIFVVLAAMGIMAAAALITYCIGLLYPSIGMWGLQWQIILLKTNKAQIHKATTVDAAIDPGADIGSLAYNTGKLSGNKGLELAGGIENAAAGTKRAVGMENECTAVAEAAGIRLKEPKAIKYILIIAPIAVYVILFFLL